MGNARFAFEFYAASDKQTGTLANMTVQLWVGNDCIVQSRGWQIREGRNGVFASGPQYKTNKVDEKTKKPVYGNYVQFFPKMYDKNQNVTSNTSDQYKAFQDQCVAEYQAWANGGNKSGRSQSPSVLEDGASLAPRIPVPAASPSVVLPAGWTTNLDRVTGRRYFADPQGNVYLEGDPRIAAILSGNQKPAALAQNDPFASFGSVPGR